MIKPKYKDGLLAMLAQYQQETGLPPSRQTIRSELKGSKGWIKDAMDELEIDGYIKIIRDENGVMTRNGVFVIKDQNGNPVPRAERIRKGQLLGELTDGESAVFEYIEAFMLEHGVAPALSEISADLNLGKSTASYLLNSIERKRWIKIIPKVPRGIFILQEP